MIRSANEHNNPIEIYLWEKKKGRKNIQQKKKKNKKEKNTKTKKPPLQRTHK